MKRSGLGTLIAAGVIAAATIILAAPAASARPIAETAQDCVDQGGRVGSVPHYEFDTNGKGTLVGRAPYCELGNQRFWWE